MSEAPHSIQPTGVISIGSNDLHLLVATSDGASSFAARVDHALLVELAATLEGNLLPVSALTDALTGMHTLVRMARDAGATAVTAIGTEAVREAANGPELLALFAATFGITATMLTGQQEAGLDYCWAIYSSAPTAPASEAPAQASPPLLVIDSGGGSTQVVLGAAPTPAWCTSLPIGAGSLTAHHIAHDPPKGKELHAVAAQVAALVDPLPRPLAPEVAVMMGGSADHLLKLTAHPQRGILTRADLEQALDLLRQKPAAKVARDFDMPPERARLLPAGAMILLHLMSHYALDAAQVKAHGIRGGFMVCSARAGAHWLDACPVPGATEARSGRQTTP
jgi:exopolyphosphatase/guanosine-5'-triphosphate,3'-diphosphate pyrophosphatase